MNSAIFDRRFIRKTMTIALPIMLQNGVTNFVNMLDNIMVGRVGTDQMTGVSIVNQLMFVWMLCIFGGLSGIGIFTAQYYGKGDEEGVRYTFRLQFLLACFLTAAGLLVFRFGDRTLISLYLHADGGVGDPEITMANALSYLGIMLIGLLPFALAQVYGSVLRSTGETVLPMRASLAAVAVNLAGNYVLIYGKLGAPALGVMGAAIATVISRFVELLYLAASVHRRTDRFGFIRGVFRSFYAPAKLIRECAVKGTPLLVNEFLWSAGQAMLGQLHSVRGLSVISAFTISSTLSNVFNVAFIAMGNATAIIIGQELGAFGKTEPQRVKHDAWRLTLYAVLLCVFMGILLFLVSGFFPLIYNTSDEIRSLAAVFIRIAAVFMPMYAFENAAYFTIRSGGRTMITFLFDSFFSWVVLIPLTAVLVYFTDMSIILIFICAQLTELIKCAIGAFLMQKGIWIRDIT